MAQLSITAPINSPPPPQFSLSVAHPISNRNPKPHCRYSGMVPQDAPQPWQLDLLLPLTHAEHSFIAQCDLDVAKKTLHLPKEDSASRGSRRARRAAQTGSLVPMSLARGPATLVRCSVPRITGRRRFFTLHHDIFPASNRFFPMAICPRFDSAATATETGPDARPSYYVVQFRPAHVPCQAGGGASAFFKEPSNQYTTRYLDLHGGLVCCKYNAMG